MDHKTSKLTSPVEKIKIFSNRLPLNFENERVKSSIHFFLNYICREGSESIDPW